MTLGINGWLTKLADKPIPIFRHRRDQALAILNDDERASSECKFVILSDPGMASNLFRLINHGREKANRIPVTAVSSLISLIGVTRLIQEIKAMTCVEDLGLAEANLKGIKRSLKESWYCSLFARQWVLDRGLKESEEVMVAAHLQVLPDLMLWCYGDDVMPRVEHKAYYECLDYQQQVEKILGCNKREIGAALVQQWDLPEMAGFSFESNYDNYTYGTAVALASMLARICQHDWYGKDLQYFQKQSVHYFGENINKTAQYLHQQLLALTAEEMDLSYRPIASLLLMTDAQKHPEAEFRLASETETNKKPAGKETPVSTTQDSVLPVTGLKLEQFNEDIGLINELVKQNAGINSLVKDVVLSLSKTLEFKRVSFLALSADKLKLESKINLNASGADDSLKQFVIDLKIPNLFNALMKKPQAFFLHERNREKYWGKISGAVKTKIQVDSFCAVSIFIGSRPIGIIYADKMDDVIEQEYFEAFQKISMILNRGLLLLSIKNK